VNAPLSTNSQLLAQAGKEASPASPLAFHPLAEIFPLLEGRAFDDLVGDIQRYGLRQPITVRNGKILDGRNRYRACLAAGVEPLFQNWTGPGLAVDYVWSLNGPRRHLDGPARQLAAGRYAIAREEEASRRQRAALNNVGSSMQICSDEAGRSATLAAKRFDVSERTVSHAKKVLKQGAPELIQRVAEGEVSVSAASAVSDMPVADQREIIARGEREILQAAKAIRQQKAQHLRSDRIRRLAEISAGNQELSFRQRFPIIYADPPWRYEHPPMSENRAIENHYPTMDLDAICALQVADLATPDALLFVWVPPPILEQCFSVIRAWGFDYRTGLVWVKDRIGMGNYVRNRHEHLLVARRGQPPLPATDARPPSVFEAARSSHSRKPESAYELIERMYPELPRIELFARNPREGWSAWGNQASGVPGEVSIAGQVPDARAIAESRP
jgi:N6-adenosine-specific RNA methylase IME4